MKFRPTLFAAVVIISGACSAGSASEVATSTTGGAKTTAAPTPTSAPTTTIPPSIAAATTAPLTGEPSGCTSLEPGSYVVGIGSDQQMAVRVPTGFAGSALPAVIDFHGIGSDGTQQASLTGYGALGELETFIVAHPTGKPSPIDARRSWELAQFDIPGQDDIALTNEIIDKLISNFCADSARVYSTGMSNGGLFTSRLVCELADRIAAAVSVAGVTHHDECNPQRPVPMMAFHGTADEVVPFDGGVSTQPGGDSDFFKQIMPDEFAEFAADFNCEPIPNKSVVSSEVIRYDYSGCDDNVPMIFFEITGGGHTWPNSVLGPFLTEFFGKTTTEVDATVDSWEFMSQFSLPD